MVYQFDADEAAELGVNEAIMVWNLRFWILKNKASEQHFHEGRTWTYNSIPAFRRLFSFWTENQIRTILEKLKDAGVIEVGNFNTNAYDRTAWYAFKDESIWVESHLHLGKNPDGNGKKPGPIPDIISDIIPDKKPDKDVTPDASPTRLQTGFQEVVFQEVENPPLLNTKKKLNTERELKLEPSAPAETSLTRQITDSFQERFLEACGAKPTWGAKEGQMIKRLLASHNVGEILVAVRKYFEMDWWFAKNGERQFGAFVTHFDEILSSHHKGKGKPGNAEEVAFLEEAARL